MKIDYEVIRDGTTLRSLKRLGLIALPGEIMRPHRKGKPATSWGRSRSRYELDFYYVNDVEGGLTTHTWTFVSKKLGHCKLKYFDGCFFPFVVRKT